MDTIVGEEPEPLSLVSIVVVGKVNVVECITTRCIASTQLTDTAAIICKIACCMWQTHHHAPSESSTYTLLHPHTLIHSAHSETHCLECLPIKLCFKRSLLCVCACVCLWTVGLRVWYLIWTRRRHLPIGADIPLGGRKHPGMSGHIHGAQSAPHRQSVPGLISDCGSVRGLARDDVRRCQRFAG